MRYLFVPLVALLLTRVPASAEEPLAKVLRDGDANAKQRALADLRRKPVDEKLHPALRAALKDEDRRVRQLAASALVWSGAADKAVIDELIRGLAEPVTPGYRASPDDSLSAHWDLVQIGEKAVPALVAALEDKKYPARGQAIWTLGKIGKPAKAAVPALEAAIRDRDVWTLHHVIEAKYRIDGDAAFAIEHLVPLLDTKEGRNCGGANRVLARMGADAKDAVPALVAAMKKYKEGEICYDLADLAPHFRDKVAPALRAAAEDPDLGQSARHALRKIGEPDPDVTVAELVTHPEKYHGKLVRIETVLKGFCARTQWSHAVPTPDGGFVAVVGWQKPDASDGDRVSFTGVFRHAKGTLVPYAMTSTRIEKREPKQP